jgi:hypothetical protein
LKKKEANGKDVTFASQKRRGGGVRREVVSSKEGSRKE